MCKMKFALFLFIVMFHLAYCQETEISDTTTTQIDTEEPSTNEPTTEALSSIESSSTEASTADISTVTTTTTTNEVTTAKTPTIEPSTAETTTIVATTTIGETTTTIPILYLNDDGLTSNWSPSSTQTVIIETDEGYQISVNVTDCNIDGENGDYAIISADGNTNGLLFTYGVSRRPAYLFNNNRLIGEFYGTNASNFSVVFTRIGEGLVITTTEIPTTTIILPTPGYNDSSTWVTYLAGISIDDYLDPTLTYFHDLKGAIALMAVEYCEYRNFSLNESVTSDNVIVNSLIPCSILWSGSETCVQLNFSVPVDLLQDADYGPRYELTTSSLKEMWSLFANELLPEGIAIYDPPTSNFTLIVVSLFAGTLLFAAILLVVRHYVIKISKRLGRNRKLSDTASIITESDGNSQICLDPHYLQDTPALFENAYPMYNPEKNADYSEHAYTNDFQYPDYQDLDVELDQRPKEEREAEESGA